MVICRKNGKCNHKYITNYHKLPQANLVTIDFRNNKQLNTKRNLNLLKQLGIIKTRNWREYLLRVCVNTLVIKTCRELLTDWVLP